MGSAMTLTRREALMDVLRRVCLEPIMEKAYAEAEARLRKNPAFVDYEKALKIIDKIRAKAEVVEEKLERELQEADFFFEERGKGTPSINININHALNAVEIKREDCAVFVELWSYWRHHEGRITEPLDMGSSAALIMAREALDLAELCTKELELINLIRETKESIAALKTEPKTKKKKKTK